MLADKLPLEYRSDPWVAALAGALEILFGEESARADELARQMSLDTLTWALELEEGLAGITPAPGASAEDRRAAVKAKWRSGGKITIAQIQAVADAWRNGETAITFPAGTVRVQFVGTYGVPEDMDGLKAAVEKVIPAHLPVEYVLRYLLIRDVHGVMTLDELGQTPLNHFAGGGM